jgi:hypothetical protein
VVVKSLKNYIIAGFAGFILLLAFQVWNKERRITELSSEVERLELNLLNLIAENKKQTSLILTYEEFKVSMTDSVAKLLKSLQIAEY